MSFKYRWKNGRPPTRDAAHQQDALLDESQFANEQDRQLAEQQARRHLGVPLQTADHDKSVLPHAAPDSGNQTI